jgi:hypothetical protein
MTEKQTKFVQHLLRKRGYRSDDWSWLRIYSVKAASKLIDMLLKDEAATQEFMTRLPAPVERPRQALLPLPQPEPKPLPLDAPQIPPEQTEFKKWAREVYARGEQTIAQLGVLFDARFGNPFTAP